MKNIDGIPQIVEGIAYYAHVGKPVADYTEKQTPGAGKYHLNYNGTENLAPIVVDSEKNPFTDMIGNGSRVAVQWSPMSYAKGKYKRPIVNAVQVLDLIETGPAVVEFTEDEVAF